MEGLIIMKAEGGFNSDPEVLLRLIEEGGSEGRAFQVC